MLLFSFFSYIIIKSIKLIMTIGKYVAPSPSGKARVCKTLTPSSNLGGASRIRQHNTCW